MVNTDVKGLWGRAVNSGGFRTLTGPPRPRWVPHLLHPEASGICTSSKEGSLYREGALGNTGILHPTFSRYDSNV